MMVLGITGTTGSGKTTLLERVRARGGCVLDCDAIYHRLLQTDQALLASLLARFPAAFSGGELNRKKLGKLVFEDPAALEDLNAVTHQAVLQEADRLLAQARSHGNALAAVDAIALFESGLDSRCDVTVAVQAPAAARIQRLMAREGIDEEYARLRMDAQPPDSRFAALTDWVLENQCATAAEFERRCDGFLDEIMGGTSFE